MIEKIDCARKFAKEKNFEAAEDILISLLDKEEDLALIYYELGKVYFDWEKYEKAIEVLEKTVNLDDELFQAYLILALSCEETNRFYSAEKAYLKAIELNPDFSSSYSQMASLYRKQKDFTGAQKILEEALGRNVKDPFIHLNLGSIYSLRGLLDKAQEELEKGMDLFPSCQEILTSLGEVYLSKRNYDKALEVFNKAKIFYPHNGYIYQNIGAIYHTMLNFTEAERYYRQAVMMEEPPAESYYFLALIRARVYEDYEEAIKLSKKAIEIDPDFVSSYIGEIEYYYRLNLLDVLKEKYENLIKLDKEKPLFFFCQGICLLHEEKFTEAIDMFHSAIEGHKINSFSSIYAVYISLANAYNYSGLTDKAIEYVKIPLLEEPYSGELNFLISLFYRKGGFSQEAFHFLEKTSELIPNSIVGYCARAYIMLDRGDLDGAFIEVKRAEELSFKSDKVSYLLGLIEERRGKKEKAIEYYNKTLDYNHLHMEARERLANL